MNGDAVLSILVLTAIALIAGSIVLLRKGGHRKQALLMLVLAAVAIVNVAIWTLPDASGEPPASKGLQTQAEAAKR